MSVQIIRISSVLLQLLTKRSMENRIQNHNFHVQITIIFLFFIKALKNPNHPYHQ